MKRYESEKKFSSYLIAGFYILIGCTVCTTLFLYSSSLRNPITRPALFEPETLEDSTPSLSTEPSTFTSSESLPEEEPSSPSSTSISFTTLNIKSSLHVRIAQKSLLALLLTLLVMLSNVAMSGALSRLAILPVTSPTAILSSKNPLLHSQYIPSILVSI